LRLMETIAPPSALVSAARLADGTLSLSDTIALFGVAVTIVAAAAAIVAAVFAIRTDRFARMEALRDDRKWDHEMKPGLKARWLGLPGPGLPGLSFYNVGGRAPNVAWVGAHAGHLFAAWASLPADFTDYVPFGTDDLGPIPNGQTPGTDTLVLIAEDVGGRWWDCITGEQIDVARSYVHRHLDRVGLEAFAGRVFQVCRL
jgi:hypothetical protein